MTWRFLELCRRRSRKQSHAQPLPGENPSPAQDSPTVLVPPDSLPVLSLDWVIRKDFSLKMGVSDRFEPDLKRYFWDAFHDVRFGTQSERGYEQMRFGLDGYTEIVGTPFSFHYHKRVYQGLLAENYQVKVEPLVRAVKGAMLVGMICPPDAVTYNPRLQRRLEYDLSRLVDHAIFKSIRQTSFAGK